MKKFIILGGDRVLWIVMLLLSLFSVLSVYTTSGTAAAHLVLLKQLAMVIVGAGMAILIHYINPVFYSKYALYIFLGFTVLLLLTRFFGVKGEDAVRDLRIPFVGLSIQPIEFIKIGVIVYTAKVIDSNQDLPGAERRMLVQMLLPLAVIFLLVAPESTSTALLLLLVCFLMFVVGGLSWRHLGTIIGIAALLGILLVGSLYIFPKMSEMQRFGTVKSRIDDFLGLDDGDNLQTIEKRAAAKAFTQVDYAKFTIARGAWSKGTTPAGPGNSTMRNHLTQAQNDFAVTIMIEEYSIAIAIVIIFMFILIPFRSGVIIRRSKEMFPALLVAGCACCITCQALWNFAMVTGFIPVSGLPLPFISSGGSSLRSTMILMAVIQGVSRAIFREEEEEKELLQYNIS